MGTTLAVLVLLLLAAQGRRASPASPAQSAAQAQQAANHAQAQADHAQAQAQQAAQAQAAPPPWPQALPAGLPPFPSGWEPAEPPGNTIVQRAWQLLPQLWKYGQGTRKTEKTGAQWITYVASLHTGGKRGVTAFRVRGGAASSPAPATMPASGGRPTLRQGSGMGALASQAPYVQQAQRRLGIAADGKFGAGTLVAVRSFQTRSGLQADGVIGPATWGALDRVAAA